MAADDITISFLEHKRLIALSLAYESAEAWKWIKWAEEDMLGTNEEYLASRAKALALRKMAADARTEYDTLLRSKNDHRF